MQTLERLLAIMARLRDPEGGCPWDVEQSFATIAPHTIEEAYEVDDAIRRGDLDGLREELGDLLLQVVFHAQMASEQGAFDFEAVAATLVDKLVRRHPHIFGDADVKTAEEQTRLWEELKAQERAEKAGRPRRRARSTVSRSGCRHCCARRSWCAGRSARSSTCLRCRSTRCGRRSGRCDSAESLGALLFALRGGRVGTRRRRGGRAA